MSMSWVQRSPQRFHVELQVLQAAANGRFVRVANHLAWEEEVRAGGARFALRITYPEDFPFAAPRVFLLYPSLPVSVAVHRYVDGSLCLHGPDEWHPTNTGVWVRGRAIAWINALVEFSATGIWPAKPFSRP